MKICYGMFHHLDKEYKMYMTEVWNICSEYENESWLLNMIKTKKSTKKIIDMLRKWSTLNRN